MKAKVKTRRKTIRNRDAGESGRHFGSGFTSIIYNTSSPKSTLRSFLFAFVLHRSHGDTTLECCSALSLINKTLCLKKTL